MASNTTKIFNTFAQSRLTAAISNAQVTCELLDDPIHLFPNWVSGTEFYMTLVDASANREIVKVTAISGSQLTIARGQGGSTARAWPIGTLIEQRPTKDDMSAFLQRAAFRTIAYNPNGVLTAIYPGEKVYQTDARACKKRWWKNVTGTKWQCIAGTICDGEVWENGYIIEGWTAYFDNTRWEIGTANAGSWDAGNQRWQASQVPGYPHHRIILNALGTWVNGYRPTSFRVTFTGTATLSAFLGSTDSFNDLFSRDCWLGTNITSGETLSLVGVDKDIHRLQCRNEDCADNNIFYITNIEFFG